MKKVIFVFISLVPIIFYGQLKVSGNTIVSYDSFTYEKVKITDSETGLLSLSGSNSSSPLMSSMLASSGSSSSIGETTGNLSITPSGAAFYEIPIALPEGINGVKPNVSLSYNSQSGNGLAGYGCNLNGVSVISRIPATKFHDNQIDGIDFDSLDRFALDGQRLILKSGTYGANGAEYETEMFSNLKIRSYGVSPFGASYGPAYFVVYYPDGSFAHYGNSTDSRTQTTYGITYWENPQGIKINYEYVIGNNSLYISKIKYGSINSANHINEVRFSYTNNIRFEQAYVNGLSFIRKQRLYQINVFSNNVLFRKYALTYINTNLNYPIVQKIQEYSGDGTLMHSPINFNYTSTNSSVNYTGITASLSLTNINKANAGSVSLDLTGNGKMDFVVYPKSTKDKFWVFKDFISGGFNSPFQVNSGVFETIFPTVLLNSSNKVLSGQGLTIVQKGTNNVVNFLVYANGTSNPINYQYTKVWNAPTYDYQSSPGPANRIKKNIPQEYISGDYNGDGLTDVLAIGKAYETRTCTRNVFPTDYYNYYNDYYAGQHYLTYSSYDDYYYVYYNGNPNHYTCNTYTVTNNQVNFINLKRDISTGFANYAGYLQQNISDGLSLYTGDIDGDGKTELLHRKDAKLFVYTLNSNNTLSYLWQQTLFGLQTAPLLLGDYNGDGKTDFLEPTAVNNWSLQYYISKGSSFEHGSKTQSFQYKIPSVGTTTYDYNLIPVDINGDGRTDIIEYNTTTYNSNSNGIQTIKVYNNSGTSLDSSVNINFNSGGTTTKTGNLNHFPIPMFLSSDEPNKSLNFASISDSWVTSFTFTMDHREDVLVRSIENNGVTYEINYNNLDSSELTSNYQQVYQFTNNEVYPYLDIENAPGTKVVTSIRRMSSGTTTLRKEFSYQGGVYNLEGLGFLGFKGMASSNWHTDVYDRIFHVEKYNPHLRGAKTDEYSLASAFTFTVPTSGYITKTVNNYGSSLATNKVFKLWNTSSLTQNSLEGTYTNVTYLYDQYNNPTKITTDFSGQGSKVVDLTYGNSTGTPYYIGRPLTEKETNTIAGNTFSSEKQFVYSGYLLTEKKIKGHNTQFDVESYVYDTFGNITKKTTTPYNTSPREILFEYDTSGRFLTKLTDVEGMFTTFQYNINTGTLSKETNPFGQETNYTYDSWNRPVNVADYLGNNVTTTYVESANSYTVTNLGDDGSGTITIYDPLKRITTVKEKDVLGQWVSVSYLYDKFDRVWKESEPYTGSGASQWNETEYDFYGRPNKMTSYTGKITNITYSGLTVSANDGTKTQSITKNAMGHTTSATDPGGTITYTYFGNGNLKSTSYNNAVTSIEQDGWGRKTKLTDPSAGIFTYAYNGFGEITNETTPKGTTTYTYSTIGKLQQKTITGDNTNMTLQYSYHPTNKFLSSLTLASADGNNATYAYTYDTTYQWLTKLSEINTHAKFTKEYTYDSFGRIDTEEYYAQLLSNSKSSTKKIKNIYQNGQLKTIRDFTTNEIISDLTGINARGQATTVALGNDMREQNTFNSFGYLTESKIEKNASSTAVELMKLTNNFNTQRGILNSRTNSMFSWSENFTYDSLDRLVNFNDNNGNKNHTYDLPGRITVNSEVGNYSYTGSSYKVNDIALNTQGNLHYQQNTLQQITYNAFKKPFEIHETGKEKIGFQYNAFMERSHMFYGDTQSDILQRKNRKHYSYDGSMEISYDSDLNKTTFVTYIGGDAYTAHAIWHSDQVSGATENYFYLHRDYLGSILMISDKNGIVKEKRHFDAWGNIVKLTDGNGANLNKFVYLDRGYTGHEHLQGVNLIHMNGRIYDPKLKRFLSPDNYIQDIFNTQNFNRYGYVLNNPLMYVDPSGEFLFEIIGLVAIVKALFVVSAAVGVYAIIQAYSGSNSNSSSGNQGTTPTPSSINSSQEIATSIPIHDGYKYSDNDLGYNYSMPQAPMGIQNYIYSTSGKFQQAALDSFIPNGNNLNIGRLSIQAQGTALNQTSYDPGIGDSSNPWKVALGTVAVLAADDITGIGVIDDFAIPIVLAGATAYDLTQRVYVTYTMTNAFGQTYVGRTSGFGNPYSIMMARASSHHMRSLGFGSPVLDRAVQGIQGYPAIRGREQQLIDFYGGIGNPKVGNRIRGVAKYNPLGSLYHNASNYYFGTLSLYTGF